MKPNRLAILLAVMVALAVGRFALAPASKEYVTAEPIVRRTVVSSFKTTVVAESPDSSAKPSTTEEVDVPGNAFPVRVVHAPPAASSVPVVAVVAPRVVQPVIAPPAPPPPPPLQVIGTYDDGGPPAVFVATPTGTLIARPGSVLLAEYRVTGITPQQVAVVEVATQRTIQLTVPGRASR